MSRLRKPVTAPDGRRYFGRWPQAMPSTGEGPFISALALTVGGVCEVALPVGRADVANNTTIFEVEPAKNWRTGLRQALSYAGQTGQKPALAIFGPADYLAVFLFIRDRLPGTGFWVYRGRWMEVTSRQTASPKHRPEFDVPPQVGAFSTVPLPPTHRLDHLVAADVTDPFERAHRAEGFARVEQGRREFERAKKRRAAQTNP